MSQLIPIEGKSDCKETLEEVLRQAGDLKGVVILGLRNDGTQLLLTSSISQYEKTFLKAFWDAWVLRWFDLRG